MNTEEIKSTEGGFLVITALSLCQLNRFTENPKLKLS